MKLILEAYKEGKLDSKQAMEYVIGSYENHKAFIEELLDKEIGYKEQLSNNLKLYESLDDKLNFDKTFSLYNTTNLIIFDLKDILSRLGEDID